jgi:hypothetical protein
MKASISMGLHNSDRTKITAGGVGGIVFQFFSVFFDFTKRAGTDWKAGKIRTSRPVYLERKNNREVNNRNENRSLSNPAKFPS